SSFCFNTPAPPDIYTLSLHDALPIFTAPCDPQSKQSRALRCTLVLAPDRPEFCRAQEKEAFEASSEFGSSFIPGIRCNRLDRHSRCLLQLFCSEGKTAFFQEIGRASCRERVDSSG